MNKVTLKSPFMMTLMVDIPANALEVIDIEPTFPPLVYLTLAPDVMISIKA